MYNQSKYAEYSSTEVNTANRLRLLVMLYDGAIRFMDVARARILEGNVSEKGKYIGKALSIVCELRNTLNFDVGGDVPVRLQQLYLFIEDRLIHANMKNDAKQLEEARRIMDILRSAWTELEEQGVGADPSLQQAEQQSRAGQNNYFKINI